jgi:CheY-like chemotaxis protein
MDLTVELFAAGEPRRVAVHDVSRTGMFLRISPPLPAGEPVDLALFFEGRQLATSATVVHGLGELDARALGRRPGIGVQFDQPTRHTDTLFLRAVDRLLARRVSRVVAARLHVVVGDPSTRLLERLSTELGDAGCTVATATNGLEVVGACMRTPPDVVVVERTLPVLDGNHVIAELAQRGLHVPVIVMAADAHELATALERGAKDILHKPFSTAELVGRCARLARGTRERVVLRADLAVLDLPAVLVMLEQERKSGRLELRGDYAAWIDLANGFIVGAGLGGAAGDARSIRSIVMTLLDWRRGELELVAAPPRPVAGSAMPITYILMEHARLIDERAAHRATA